jgi:hypothetical protein
LNYRLRAKKRKSVFEERFRMSFKILICGQNFLKDVVAPYYSKAARNVTSHLSHLRAAN